MTTTRPAIAGGLLAVAGAVLAFLATQVSTDLTHQRSSTCNGLLPMPTSAYVLGWTGVAAGVIAVVLLVSRLRQSRGGWPVWVLVLAVLVVLFAGFVVYTVYGDAPTTRFQCSG
ncbi:hypothetical protein [Actinocrispum sp. NPDC049592]|uniref:hypothetical protein n=1 Tax=Actinocrispum sp. NPDC049592 TaxID=3154835 RepID=UPI00342D6C17